MIRPALRLLGLAAALAMGTAATAVGTVAQTVVPKSVQPAQVRIVPKNPPPAASRSGPRELTAEEADELLTFVNGNVLFFLYHEIGHALVHRLEIPVLGREEDAVDSLAAWLMVPDEMDPAAAQLLQAAGDGHALSAWYAEDDDEDDLAFWDEHSHDLQRFASIYCLLYGSNPEAYADLADEVEMPDYERERCPWTYQQVESGWLAVLSGHLRSQDGARRPGSSGGRILVSFGEPRPPLHPGVRRLVEEPGLVQAAAEGLASLLVLPDDIPVKFMNCGEANAFYDPQTGEVQMCYELVDWFVEIWQRERDGDDGGDEAKAADE